MTPIETYWNTFIQRYPEYENEPYEAWHFCDNEEDANELAQLTKARVKRGTASLEKSYAYENEAIPQVGSVSIILNWYNEPVCIIKTIKIDLYPFKDVPEAFARVEGEGDKSLAYWRTAHRNFFGREASAYGFQFEETLTVICEEFKMIYP